MLEGLRYWWHSLFNLSLHPCAVCKCMMRANGCGICSDCLEKLDLPEPL